MYLKSVENFITLGKLIGLLFLFCLPFLSILFLKAKRNDLARPVMGAIFLVMVIAAAINTNISIRILLSPLLGFPNYAQFLTNYAILLCFIFLSIMLLNVPIMLHL